MGCTKILERILDYFEITSSLKSGGTVVLRTGFPLVLEASIRVFPILHVAEMWNAGRQQTDSNSTSFYTFKLGENNRRNKLLV